MQNLEKVVSLTLVATNLFLISAILILFFFLARFLDESRAELLTVAILTPLTIVFSEIIPKSIFRSQPTLIFKTVKLFQLLYYTIYPLSYLFYYLPSRLINLASRFPRKRRAISSKEEIKMAITRSEEKGILEEHETTILYKVFALGKKQVQEIMVPIQKVAFLDKELNLKQAFEEFKKYKFSRLPVYEREKEDFIGLVNYMDFLIQQKDQKAKIVEIMHPIIFVDDNAYLDDLLIRMLKEKAQLVGIKNSIGMTVGIVTLEDVLEEIVGEY
jgi:CBS domain containing-hemolysin-like protein